MDFKASKRRFYWDFWKPFMALASFKLFSCQQWFVEANVSKSEYYKHFCSAELYNLIMIEEALS